MVLLRAPLTSNGLVLVAVSLSVTPPMVTPAAVVKIWVSWAEVRLVTGAPVLR